MTLQKLLCFSLTAAAISLTPTRTHADETPCDPVSPLLEAPSPVRGPAGSPTSREFTRLAGESSEADFCAEWNPDFAFRGYRCCPVPGLRKVRHGAGRWCTPKRLKTSFCDEMTDEQRDYLEAVSGGSVTDVLEEIAHPGLRKVNQAYCSVNNGFLAWGRPVVSTKTNRIRLRNAHRCLNFGTDEMAGMIEWVGRQVATRYTQFEYQGVRLLVGDVSAPRGGCLPGRGGRRGHASHTSGQDADIGFLTARRGFPSPDSFHQKFDPEANWWLVRQLFSNPYACVKVIFLDRRWIAKLAHAAARDPLWNEYRRFIRHARAHRNHMHVRVGDGPGPAGCGPGARPEFEEDDSDEPGSPGSPAVPSDQVASYK